MCLSVLQLVNHCVSDGADNSSVVRQSPSYVIHPGMPAPQQVILLWTEYSVRRTDNINIHQSQGLHSSCVPNHRMPAQQMVREMSEKGSKKRGAPLTVQDVAVQEGD